MNLCSQERCCGLFGLAGCDLISREVPENPKQLENDEERAVYREDVAVDVHGKALIGGLGTTLTQVTKL